MASCLACGCSVSTAAFQVPFPDHSPTKRAFSPGERPDVPCWEFQRCTRCGLCFVSPGPTAEAIEDFYAHQVDPSDWELIHYVCPREATRDQWSETAKELSRLRGGPGNLIEVGCAAGWLLHAARKQGWNVRGCELAPKFARFALDELDLPVQNRSVMDLSEGFDIEPDVIAAFDVLEHMSDPVGALRIMRSWCTATTWLVFTVPRIDNWSAKWHGLKWRQILPSHTTYWTTESLHRATQAAGFEVLRISDPRYWRSSYPREIQARAVEFGKFLIRATAGPGYRVLSDRFPSSQLLASRFLGGRLNHERLMYSLGDQAVLGDVALVVARAI